MKKYNLVNKHGRNIEPIILIDEDAKEEFKIVMNWSEEEWNDYTEFYQE